MKGCQVLAPRRGRTGIDAKVRGPLRGPFEWQNIHKKGALINEAESLCRFMFGFLARFEIRLRAGSKLCPEKDRNLELSETC